MGLAGLTRWALIAALVASLVGGLYLLGRSHGRAAERAVWIDRQLIAERAARQTETDLAEITARRAAEWAAKEREQQELKRERDEEWKKLMASLPRCRLPARVGRLLNAAAGLPEDAAVAQPPAPRADGPDPDPEPTIGAEVVTDACKQNNEAGFTNQRNLTEGIDWYEEQRQRVNSRSTE